MDNENTMTWINQQRVRQTFDGAAHTYDAAAVLQREVCARLLEKLDVVRLKPAIILDAGAGTGQAIDGLYKRFSGAHIIALDIAEKMLLQSAKRGSFFKKPSLLCADVAALPLADNSVDLVFSSLSLQWCNDLGMVMQEILRVLKPGGLFVFTTFGPDTLKELRFSWQQVDNSTHVNEFLDMHDIGDALLQSQYAEPVMESEIITVNYSRVDDLMLDLKNIGANVTSQGHRQGLTTRNMLSQVTEAYERFRTDAGLPASYEIVYGHAWKSADKVSRQGKSGNASAIDKINVKIIS